jgi:hypothetical protein
MLFNNHDCHLHLKGVLFVPQASIKLIFDHKLDHGNNAYVEYWHEYLSIKDQEAGKFILRAKQKGVLYPLPCKSSLCGRHVLVTIDNPSPI